MSKNKLCIFCKQNGYKRKARYLAEQSYDKGKTITKVLICKGHADGWNEASDWEAKLYPIKKEE